jgi:hypothetical protein
VQQATQKGSCRKNHSTRTDLLTAPKHHARRAALLEHQVIDLGLYQGHAPQAFDNPPDHCLVCEFVALRPRAPDGWSARSIEYPELYADAICRPALNTPEGVNLGHQVTLADATDGRVARHLGDGSTVECH